MSITIAQTGQEFGQGCLGVVQGANFFQCFRPQMKNIDAAIIGIDIIVAHGPPALLVDIPGRRLHRSSQNRPRRP